MRATILIAICSLAVSVSAQESFSPAQLQTGAAPALPAMAVGGGQVLLEVSVGADGRVTDIKPLRATPPFTEMLTQAVHAWRFRPAQDVETPTRQGDNRSPSGAVASKVL